MYFCTGEKENKYGCSLTIERLQMTPAELQGCADQVKEGRNPASL